MIADPQQRTEIPLPGYLRITLLGITMVLAGCLSSRGAAVRYVSMEAAPRALYIGLTTNLHVAFDTKLLRIHTAWTGPGLDLESTPHTGNKTPFYSKPIGAEFFTSSPVAGWSAGDSPIEPALTTTGEGQFVSWSRDSSGVRLSYRLGGTGQRVIVVETLRPLTGFEQGFARDIDVSTATDSVWFSPVSEFIDARELRMLDEDTIAIHRSNDWLIAARRITGRSSAGARLDALTVQTNEIKLRYPLEQANGGDSERAEVERTGRFARVLQRFPPGTRTTGITFAVLAMDQLPVDPHALSDRLHKAIQPVSIESNETRKEIGFTGSPAIKQAIGGDDYYAVESLPLPPEADLKVTGMDWLSDDDLAVCTWPGEVWIVKLANESNGPRYHRFASGLQEPLGLAVVDGDIVVAQKPQLTRLRDTDGDGLADRFECLNDDWGFTGNYHAFTFGPAVDADGGYLLAFCGQRARWDVKYAGWLVRISADGTRLDPIAGGLRAPNGIGLYGPDRDIFTTDNQGNWIGACKLNHIHPGRTYGYPVARPGTREQWDQPSPDFDPPVVWFPRKLAPSASGFATIPDAGFGPFGGQLVVADFQNAVVLRVALEKVNGRWQGAVFPFLKGFGSGANRLTFDRRGRLYVGGLENKAWPSAGPREHSLDRVTFTGKAPFEFKEVHALPDGFEITFTGPANREFAGDPDSYYVSQFNYEHHPAYGSAEFDHDGKAGSATTIELLAAELNADGTRVRLKLRGWKPGYVTRVVASALESQGGQRLRSDEFYYTLNAIPGEP